VELDPVERRLQISDQHGAQDKGNAEAERVGKEHQHTFQNMALLGGEHQRGAEKGADTGGPANGEYNAEQRCGEKAHVVRVNLTAAAAEEIQLEYAKVIQTEENHDQTGDDVHRGLIFAQKAAQSSGEGAHQHENHSKAEDEADGAAERFFRTAFTAAGKVRYIDGEHGQKTGRDKGNDTLQKRDQILHLCSHSFLYLS